MTPSTTLSICFNKKNSKLILQIDFSQMDTETQEKFLADLFEKALQKNLQAYWITTTETKNELTREEFSNLLKENMIELILHKKSIQIDETLLNVKEHLEKFYSNKEQETIAKTLESQTELTCSYLWDKDFSLLEKHLENSLGHFTFESEFALLKDKEPLNLAQIKQIGVLKVITYEMTQALKNQIIHLTQVVNEENLEFDEELVIYHLDFKLNQNTYKVLAKFCVIKKERNIAWKN
ncbi:hypothetical protein HMPREF1398_00065 [Helicobacter pylori GAM117Ai]|nr:hypothetical protein HMPREF1398_00065 [Helicobacter pylori GAM117Ai]